jgi:hypothetical protein
LVVVAAALAIFVVVTRRGLSTSTAADVAESGGPGGTGVTRIRRSLPTITATSTEIVDAPRVVESSVPTHAAGPKCESCSVENCVRATDGCDRIVDVADRKLCEELYECFADPAHNCVNQGDPVRCWCGTHPTTCLTDTTGPNRANGPCLEKILAGAKSSDPQTIRARFVDPDFPLGSAVNLTLCRGSWCSDACKVN